jgi:hypothetical protein
MATGKVARRTAVGDVGELLDSPEVAALICDIDASGDARGRKGFGTRALVGACLVKSLFSLPTWTRVAALIAEHPGLQAVLGDSPSIWACYRFTEKLRANQPLLSACLDRVAESLQDEFPGIGEDVAIDASDMPAYGNGQSRLTRYGPLRERFSDPDASWGHRSSISTRKGGGFYGYKLHLAVCTRTELPLAWRVETGRRNESLYVAPLLDALHARGYKAATCAMDKGYDNDRVYGECEDYRCRPIIPLKNDAQRRQLVIQIPPDGSRMSPFIPRGSRRFRDLYIRRAAVEREFGRLKHEAGLAPLRVRGLERVALHVDLTMLARLAQALSRVREQAVPLAA